MSIWVFCACIGWMTLSLIYWWIALTKVWLSKARGRKMQLATAMGDVCVWGKSLVSNWLWKTLKWYIGKVLICVCVCVCVHYIVILTQWNMTKKNHFWIIFGLCDEIGIMWWKYLLLTKCWCDKLSEFLIYNTPVSPIWQLQYCFYLKKLRVRVHWSSKEVCSFLLFFPSINHATQNREPYLISQLGQALG